MIGLTFLAIMIAPLFTNSTLVADSDAVTRPASTKPAGDDRQAAEADVKAFLDDDLPTGQRLAAAERVRAFLQETDFFTYVVPRERAHALLADENADHRLRVHALAYVRLTHSAQSNAAELLTVAERPEVQRAVFRSLHDAFIRSGANFSGITMTDELVTEVKEMARNSDDPEMRVEAIGMIIEFNGTAQVESLVGDALKSPDTDVRVLIASLKVVNGYTNQSRRDKFLPLVKPLIDHPDPDVARLASAIAASRDKSSSDGGPR